MNRREARAVEYYGYALIAGMPKDTARKMTPGWISDMFNVRAKYDAKMSLKGLKL